MIPLGIVIVSLTIFLLTVLIATSKLSSSYSTILRTFTGVPGNNTTLAMPGEFRTRMSEPNLVDSSNAAETIISHRCVDII